MTLALGSRRAPLLNTSRAPTKPCDDGPELLEERPPS